MDRKNLPKPKKISLITGGATRLGRKITHFLLKLGYEVVIIYNKSQKEAEELKAQFSNLHIKQLDLTKSVDYSTLFHEINQEIGTVSLLINNAANFFQDHLSNITEKTFDANFTLNFKVPLFLSKSFAMQNELEDGLIINITDSITKRTHKNLLSYSLSKQSLTNLTHQLSYALAPNIRVNAISPFIVLDDNQYSQEIINKLISASKGKKRTSLEDIYSAIEFIIKNDSLTGQVIEF